VPVESEIRVEPCPEIRRIWASAYSYPDSEVGETRFETFLVDLGFAPGEGVGGLHIALDERIDVLPHLDAAGEAGAPERGSAENGEPSRDLVEPGGMGRGEVEVNIFVAGEPAPALGLVGVEIEIRHTR